jgi:Tfp pilus assembly PilM family ATPase
MPRERYTTGIDVHDDELRVVQVKEKGQTCVPTAAFSEPLPAGAVMHGMVQQPGLVAVALQKAIARVPHSKDTEVVIGVSPSATTARTLSLPPSSDEEFRSLLSSEVQFQRVLQSEGGAYGFVELEGLSDTGRQAAVIAVEQGVLANFADTIDRSMIDVLALEPSQFGVLRAVSDKLDHKRPSLLLIVSPVCTDIVFYIAGRPAFFRRIDVGSKSLKQDAEQLGAGYYPRLHGLEHLCTEVQRSLDFLERETAEDQTLERVILALDDKALVPLHNFFEERLGLPVELLRPVSETVSKRDVRYELCDSPDSIRYMAAFGLAQFRSELLAALSPRYDLLGKFGAPPTLKEQIHALSIPISVAASFLVVAALFAAHLTNNSAEIERQTIDISKQAADVRREADLAMGEQARMLRRFDLLKREGVPLEAVMDTVARGLPAGVGLSAVTINGSNEVRIEGEATSEAAMLQALENLRNSPVLRTFGRDTAVERGLRFELSGTTVSMGDVRLASEDTTLR